MLSQLDEVRIRAAVELELRRRREEERRSLSFREFVNRVYPRYQWYRHCEVLANVLQRVADGNLKRVLVFMPPRGGKSQLASKLFPAYLLYKHPQKWVGINSYAAELAYTFSRASRDAYRDIGGVLREDASAVKNWETPEGGGCWAAGVGGPITGKGFGSCGIIDDPLKNAEEAMSDRIRSKQKDWYGSTFYTRAEPDAAIVVVQTRWHEDDLSGWLIGQERSGEDPENWHVVNFEAIKEETAQDFPASCTIEPDWRQAGEALNPERFDLKKLKRIKGKVGTLFWSALYQQRPSPLEGDYFKRSWWQFYRELPDRFDEVVLSWDCAFKETKSSDFVVGQVWGKLGGRYYLLDQIRDRMDINSTLQAIRILAARYPDAHAKLIEDKANGSAVVDLLKREVSGLIPIEPEGGKVVRAVAIAPYVEAGNIFLPDSSIAPWIHDFILEFSQFPNGVYDDQVDACTQAINWLESHQTVWVVSEAGWGY
ncbi:phage terminase large subunit [Leptolyngbya sp. FACHB-541]|uniref:phage terminase large subunit n=1 Tax=Leptolyngbya sp. FACHB-541 TaxID=2692810 RepID=UPI0016882D54|nr:phage terminase large subunit [Leptolyngbya sp. FACHB-541]MBD1995245.1 phage terminase large subunit [Leptolyngbya sp. FACHB-541]